MRMGVATPGAEKEIEVRKCERSQLKEIQEILVSAPEAAGWSEAALAETLERDPEHFLAGWQGKELAGFVVGRKIAREGEILNLAVKAEYRRRGVGQAVAQALLDVFAGEGVGKVFLEVRESNTAAIALYERLGFRSAGRREGYYQGPEEAAVVLEARIEPGDVQAATTRRVP